MAGDLETIKTIATVAAPLTAAIVDTWIKPKLETLSRYLRTDKALLENSLANKFEEYLLRAYEKNSYISVIVFQNQQKRIEDIYIPLTVTQPRTNKSIAIDYYREEFIPTFKRVLIKDTAGMGKSTISRWLFLSCVKQNQGIPILIELRKLTGDQTILGYLHNELNPIDDEFDVEFILRLVKQGDFVFFLDGYDEIPFSQRDEVTRGLQDFISKAGNNLFVMTSRPESSLASFAEFQEFNIQPLNRGEAFELLRKYDRGGGLSAEIISKLKEGTLKNIDEFLETPLLVSLLYKSYEYKPTIPFKKHIFYRQVYDALFESHDLTKGGSFLREKRSQLDVEDFHRVLRALGFITIKLGQIEFDKDTILRLLSETKGQCYGLNFSESDFLSDLLTTVPLFNRDGNYFRWAHKSIQEYFAAQFIWLDAKNNQAKLLRQIVRSDNNEKYSNVLDLYYDMDYKTFRQTIIYDHVCDFLGHYNSTYSLINRDRISEDDIHDRKVLTFGMRFVLVRPGVLDSKDEDIVGALTALLPKLEDRLLGFKVFMRDRIVVFTNHNIVVNLLLVSKTDEMFLELSGWKVHEQFAKGEKDDYEERIRANEKVFDFILKNMDKDAVLVDDDPNSYVNQPTVFDKIHQSLYGRSPGLQRPLDPNKCRSLKTEIESEMAKEASGEFLFNDI